MSIVDVGNEGYLMEHIAELEAKIERWERRWDEAIKTARKLEKNNDDTHELAEHYRVENGRLREALVEIINTPNKAEGESAETLVTMMQDIAFAALGHKPPEGE